MNFTWNEYKETQNVVNTFEKERNEIKEIRDSIKFKFPQTYNDILWTRRNKLSEFQYEVMNLPKKRRKELGEEFINKLVNEKIKSIQEVMINKYKTEEV